LRFFSTGGDLDEAAHWAAGADGSDRIGILATDSAGQILAHAVCCRFPGEVDIEFPTSAWRLVASRLERAGPPLECPLPGPPEGISVLA
jgi:hypothetical protein